MTRLWFSGPLRVAAEGVVFGTVLNDRCETRDHGFEVVVSYDEDFPWSSGEKALWAFLAALADLSRVDERTTATVLAAIAEASQAVAR